MYLRGIDSSEIIDTVRRPAPVLPASAGLRYRSASVAALSIRPEIEVLTGLLDGVRRTGAALVLRGDPGIGKSRLLSEATALGEERQMNVLMTRGVAFAGVQQLLRPVRSQRTGLTASYQGVLDTALGMVMTNRRSTFASRWPFLTCYRTRQPIALCCWSQRTHIGWTGLRWMSSASSREGLNLIRLSCWRGLATATPPFSARGSCPSFRLQPLDPESATRLLGDSADHLTAGERSRILREAAGNPLSLVELPSIAHRLDDDHLMPGVVPLTERMERAFAARAADLPLETQLLLLVAALNDSESLSEVLQAGRVVADEPVGVEVLQAAADVTIVELDERRYASDTR